MHFFFQLVEVDSISVVHNKTFVISSSTNHHTVASAFVAPATRVSSSSLKMQFSEALGAQAPLGFWDPLGLLKDADQERFDRLRYVRKFHLLCLIQADRLFGPVQTVKNIFDPVSRYNQNWVARHIS